MGCLFILLMVSFDVQKLFSLMESHLFTFSLFSLPKEIYQEKNILWKMSEILLFIFSSRIFMFLQLTFKSFIHFEFILVCGVRRWSSFIFLQGSVQFSQHHLLNKLSLAHCMLLHLLSNINWLKGTGLYWGSLFCAIHLCVFLSQYLDVLITMALYYS